MIDSCKHRGFIAREEHGHHRFICRECEERFITHPWVKKKIVVTSVDPIKVMSAMQEFREGIITFQNALKATGMACEDFTDTIKKIFPPEPIYEETHLLGSVGIPIMVDVIPQRQSCPKEVDEFFHNKSAYLDLTLSSVRERFPDVVDLIGEASGFDNQITYLITFLITFADGSVQRVEIRDDYEHCA